MELRNWPINTGRDGYAITATSASAATLITTKSTSAELIAHDVMVDNPGPTDVYVAAGGSAVVATLNSVRVPANSLQPYFKGDATHIACITASGSQSILIHVGDGQ
jgi:hypothetical protein